VPPRVTERGHRGGAAPPSRDISDDSQRAGAAPPSADDQEEHTGVTRLPSPIVAIGAVAGPLLAAISFTLVVLVLQSSHQEVRWLDQALLLLTGAGVVFIFHVQAAQWTDRYRLSPAESRKWAKLGTFLYDAGVVMLLGGVALLLVPPRGMSNWRLATVLLAALAVLAEIAWVGLAMKRTRAAKRRLAERPH
jgi:nitrate reductase gamma subunit